MNYKLINTRVFIALVRRELEGYFYWMSGYAILAVVAFLTGLGFTQLIHVFSVSPAEAPITELFFETYYFWLIVLLATPILTMRSFALEKFSGTFETLMTTPVRDWEVTLAKFSASMILYMVIWVPLAIYIGLIQSHISGGAATDYGAWFTAFIGIFLVGCLYISMGCFASSLTENQIIAAILSFALGVGLFFLSFVTYRMENATHWIAASAHYVSLVKHMNDFVRGVIDTRHVTFYLTSTGFFLFLTWKTIESRRWK